MARTRATTTCSLSPSRTRPDCTIRAGTSGRFDDVGLGAELDEGTGLYGTGWGVGRHVLGSNYFYYVQDPWGSWAEYSYDIDFVPADVDWPAADHPPEDSFYVWGPTVPDDFIVNHETTASRLTGGARRSSGTPCMRDACR